ncbi:MAG: 6-hydroxymethylpterin diphosphokinase MptE-like protein [Spirochaetia bacterium]
MNNILAANLQVLKQEFPVLYQRVREIHPSPEVSAVMSRSGHTVSKLSGKALHSLYDPVRDGNKFLSLYPPDGYLVFFGIGDGYHINPYINRVENRGILIIEKNLSVFRSFLETANFTSILRSPKVRLCIEPEPAEVRDTLVSGYIPVLHGTLRTVPLRPAVDADPEFFHDAAAEIESALENHRRDFAVQSRFGLPWFRNILKNLAEYEPDTGSFFRDLFSVPAGRVFVAAAGPDLERSLGYLKNRSKSEMVIAADTSLPALLSAGVQPDAVVTLDCQIYSRYHFFDPKTRKIPLIADCAVHPGIFRQAEKTLLFNGGHPLAGYISRNCLPLISLDTRGGSVTQTALAAAEAAGAEEIILNGADFGYPSGKAYARGTYLYPYFEHRSGKLKTAESSWYELIMNQGAVRDGDTGIYRTPVLSEYHRTFRETAERLSAEVIKRTSSRGEEILHPHGKEHRPRIPENVPGKIQLKKFFKDYSTGIKNLDPEKPAASLPRNEQELWYTLLPFAGYIKRCFPDKDTASLLRAVKEKSTGIIKRYCYL